MSKISKGFTIIELIVVIAIITVLASIIMVNVSKYISMARDARRKLDLNTIANDLALYYAKNGRYPCTTDSDPCLGSASAGDDAEKFSGYGDSAWIPELVSSGVALSLPLDPLDHDQGPFCGDGGYNTIYTYESDGQHFILCAWMENTSDADTLQFKDIASPFSKDNGELLYAGRSYAPDSFVIAQ